MTKNMGNIDRIVRTILAVAFIVVAVIFGGWFWILAGLAAIFLITSVISTCPIYKLFGISTRKESV